MHRNKIIYYIVAVFGICVIFTILNNALKTPEQDAQDKLHSQAQSILKERLKEQQEQDAELQKKYDDQAKYEEWIAWQQQNTPEKRIRDSLSDKTASVNVSNQGNDSYQVSITTKANMRKQFEYITMSEHEKNVAMVYEQCRHIVKDIQDSEVPVSLVTIYLTGKTQDSEGYINDNDNIAICGVKGNANCKDIYSFQNYVTRLWMVNGL